VDDAQAKLVERVKRLKAGAMLWLALLVPLLLSSPAGAARGPTAAANPAVAAKALLDPGTSVEATREEPGDPLDYDPHALPAASPEGATLQLFPASLASAPSVAAPRLCVAHGFWARGPPLA
jgi:hypothetical protein